MLSFYNEDSSKLDINIDFIPEHTKTDKLSENIISITLSYEKYNKINGINTVIIEDVVNNQNLL